MRRWLGSVGLILVCCAAASEAGAADDAGAADSTDATPDTAAAPSDREAAAQHELDLAQESTRERDLPAALRHLQAAYAIYPDPRLLYNLGQIERAMNRPVDAVGHLKQFLRNVDRGDGLLEAKVVLATKELSDLLQLGEIEVMTLCPAEVVVDDTPADTTSVVVSVGKHVIRIRCGSKGTMREVDVPAGQHIVVDARLLTVADIPPGMKSLSVTSRDAEKPQDRSLHRPIYRRWQFWTAVAGVLAAVGATIFISRSLRPPMCPANDECAHFPGS